MRGERGVGHCQAIQCSKIVVGGERQGLKEMDSKTRWVPRFDIVKLVSLCTGHDQPVGRGNE